MHTTDDASCPRPEPRTPRRRLQLGAAVAAVGLLAAAACRSADPIEPSVDALPAVTAQSGADIALAPGGTARVTDANVHVTFTRLVGDSRCCA